jgi:arylsulfatase
MKPIERPNILLITTDQQRGDCLGLENQALLTPNLDYLARSGAHFHRGYSECPSCFPSRRTLMTGMAPAAQGMVGMRSAPWAPAFTLAGELTRADYQTQLVGKLHLGEPGRRFGFEHMVHSDGPYVPGDAYARWLQRTHGRDEVEAGTAHGLDVNGWVGRP